MRHHLILFIVLLFSPVLVFAQNDLSLESSIPSDFSDEGLGDADLELDLAAEALPTTDRVRFWLERLRNNVASVFTFNVERKAAQLRLRLHQMDRKLTACAEIGDEECVAKIEVHIQALKDRTERYITRHEELSEQHQQRFEEWRQRRESRIERLRQLATDRRANRTELLEQRRAKSREARANRRDYLRNKSQESREQLDLRQQNREQLIELRSQNLKDRLDDTRSKILEREIYSDIVE